MADPFAMMNRSMDKATKSKKGAKAKNAGYKPKALDPDDPTDAAYLRAMHPDFDDIMDSANSLDYKTRCIQDADFGKKIRDTSYRRACATLPGAHQLSGRCVLGT